ncbi:MAG: chorismate mutase [Acidobacteriia bacterium]|nr:chorismate mutase [Terriglobia bacterium]
MTQEEARRKLEEFRVQIDEVDRRIVALLNERTLVVEDIGRVKRQAQLPIYEPKREDQVFANVTHSNHGPISQEAVRRIFERIIDEMRTIQKVRMMSGTSLPAGPSEGRHPDGDK